MQMAVCKTGHKVLYSSQLNSLSVHLSLFEQTKCNHMFSAVGVNVSDIIRSRPMTAHAVPELEDLLNEQDKVPHFPYTKTFEEAVNDPCAYSNDLLSLVYPSEADLVLSRYDITYKRLHRRPKAHRVCLLIPDYLSTSHCYGDLEAHTEEQKVYPYDDSNPRRPGASTGCVWERTSANTSQARQRSTLHHGHTAIPRTICRLRHDNDGVWGRHIRPG